jgi:hypothetical protein
MKSSGKASSETLRMNSVRRNGFRKRLSVPTIGSGVFQAQSIPAIILSRMVPVISRASIVIEPGIRDCQGAGSEDVLAHQNPYRFASIAARTGKPSVRDDGKSG